LVMVIGLKTLRTKTMLIVFGTFFIFTYKRRATMIVENICISSRNALSLRNAQNHILPMYTEQFAFQGYSTRQRTKKIAHIGVT